MIGRAVCLALIALGCAATGLAADKPNILFVLTDDQGWWDVGIRGNKDIDTPVLDRFAREGVDFTRFYAAPVCAPTRAGIVTGRYAFRTGLYNTRFGGDTLGIDEITIAEMLKQAGYRTGCFGKWHLGKYAPYQPHHRGFDEFLGHYHGHIDEYDYPDQIVHNGRPVEARRYVTDLFTDAAIEFIENSGDQPWFCYVPFNAPHSPWVVGSGLEIRSSPFDDEGMAHLAGHPSLQFLVVTGSNVTTEGFAILQSLPTWPAIQTDVPLDFDRELLQELVERDDPAAVSWAAHELVRKFASPTDKLQLIRDLLASKDPQIRKAGVSLAQSVSSVRIAAWTEALSSDFVDVRITAAYGLAGEGPRRAAAAAPELVLALDDPQTCWPAALALVHIGGDARTSAVPTLVQLAAHEDPEQRAGALLQLGRVGRADSTVVPAIMSALSDSDEPVRVAAIRALGMIGPDAEAAVPTLLRELEVAATRIKVAETLIRIRSQRGVEAGTAALLELLDADSKDDRVASLRALSLLERPAPAKVIRASTSALHDDSLDVRLNSALALAALGHPAAAVPVLVELLEEKPYAPWTRRRLLETLVEMASHDSVEAALPEVLRLLGHGDPHVQLWAVNTVAAAGTKAEAALPKLRQLESGSPWQVRDAASRAIRLVGHQ